MLLYALLGISMLMNICLLFVIGLLERRLDDLSDKLYYAQASLDPIECAPWEVDNYGE